MVRDEIHDVPRVQQVQVLDVDDLSLELELHVMVEPRLNRLLRLQPRNRDQGRLRVERHRDNSKFELRARASLRLGHTQR